MASSKDIDVMAMVDDYADKNQIDPATVFKQHPVSGKVKAELEGTELPTEDSPAPSPAPSAPAPKKKEWTPDPSLLAGMEEFEAQPVTYDKKDLELKDEDLKNISDDNAMQDAIETMDELHRTHVNIEAAKKRHGISKFQIPPGEYHARITAAAGDTNYRRAQEGLDEIFNEIKKSIPEFIMEWMPGFEPKDQNGTVTPPITEDHLTGDKLIKLPTPPENNSPETPEQEEDSSEIDPAPADSDSDEVKIIIDKRDLPEIGWTAEEMEKIRRSRTVELNIVESADLKFGEIEDISGNLVDRVLEPYHRKVNDVVASLPASHYRATFFGLSYPEVTDLSNSEKMNNTDGEWKKWSIVFDHIKNQSIGPWEEYAWYIHPETKKKIRMGFHDNPPAEFGIDDKDIHRVSKFIDFLMKTSYIDLEFMLWKILCATAMDKEIVSVTCKSEKDNGAECGHSYDWVYAPSDLLLMDSIDVAVLEEMKKTGEAGTEEEILANYNESLVNSKNTVKLASSGINVIIGHASAYDYLTEIYPMLDSLEETDGTDPSVITTGMAYTTLIAIKGILVPKPDGTGHYRITDYEKIADTFRKLDSIDWTTVGKIVEMMIEPYRFEYSIRGLVCPKCKARSSIRIPNLERLLFTVARSLESVQVELKKT